MLAVAEGRPETLSLKRIIEHHIDFQFEVNTRKYQTVLDKELHRKEIQEGLIKACDVIDLIIEILRGSKSQQQVKDCLVLGVTDGIKFKSRASRKQAEQLKFTEAQAAAILEIEALQKEYEITLEHIETYQDLLNNYDSMANLIVKELKAIKKEYGRERRTVVENGEEAVYEEKKAEAMEVVFLMDRFGYARTVDPAVYERNKEAADAESKYVLFCMNTDKLCVMTDTGSQHLLKVMDVPYGKFRDKGKPIDNICNYDGKTERIIFVDTLQKVRMSVLIFVTEKGMIKQVEGTEFDVAKRTIAATKLGEEDKVVSIATLGEAQTCVFRSHQGMCLRIAISEIPQKKNAAIGVRGMKLDGEDRIEEVYYPDSEKDKVIYYKEKEVHLDKLKIAGRDTKGTRIRV